MDTTPLIGDVERMDVVPHTKGFVHRFRDEDVARIEASDLDVVLRFGFNILRGPILSAARYGVWSYPHGDNDLFHGGPALFWEVCEDCPISGVTLSRVRPCLPGMTATHTYSCSGPIEAIDARLLLRA